MAIIIKQKDLEFLREGGKRLATILKEVSIKAKPGIKTSELDRMAKELIKVGGDKPSFLNYTPEGSPKPYPATLCISVNDEIVHGIPGEKILKEGDIVGLDLGLIHNGIFVDTAITVPIGEISNEDKKLMEATKEALYAGIKKTRAGNNIGDIGYAIEEIAKRNNYGLVLELGGHGVGYKVHEDPYVPNFGKRGTGLKLKIGMVLALEPMFNIGGGDILLDSDDFTFRTADGKKSAHFEHTVLITEDGPEIITKI